jgi:hypothetical protein
MQSRWLGTMGSVNRDFKRAERLSARARAKLTVPPGCAAVHRKQGRGLVVRLIAALLAMFWGLAFYGLIDLLAFAQGPEFRATLLLSTGWGLLFLVLVTTPLVTLCVRPSAVSRSALVEVALVGVAVILAAGAGGSSRQLFVATGLFLTVAVLAAVAGRRYQLLVSGWRWSAAPGALVILALGPCCAYAWSSARMTGGAGLTDDTWGFDHWPVQSALPLALLLISAFAAGHPGGWRLPTWSAGAAAAWFAVVCWLEPGLVGSVSRPWAAMTFAWATTFVAATHLTARDRSRPASITSLKTERQPLATQNAPPGGAAM